MSLQEQIENYRIHFGAEMPAGKAEEVIGRWRAAAQAVAGAEAVELAAPFQRHYTSFGTGLPPNFCLVLTAGEALAFKFDPRHSQHPLDVAAKQIKKEAARWPRGAVRATGVVPGRMAYTLELEIADGPGGVKTIACRTPRLSVNPAAAVLITELGGQLPAPG
ncbi:MAG: hypothetical protein QOJ22_398 [Thermoleophilaceae bacterium]|nr:hypothetical protein [Thermoleophilaceae bacterium]